MVCFDNKKVLISEDKKVYISSPNDYTKDYDFKFVQMSNKYVPYSYQGLLNVIYSTLNNFKFPMFLTKYEKKLTILYL